MDGKIYVHKNKLNGMCYVGQTIKKNPNDRWNNGLGYINSSKFYNAIKKYGWDGFDHIVLPEVYTDQNALNDAEADMIVELNSIKNGYNLMGGGSRGSQSLETRQKQSIANKGRIVSIETRKKLSDANKLRKPMSIETREKISEAAKNRSPETRQKMSCAGKGSKGREVSLATREKLSNAGKNKHPSLETRQKQSVANKGRVVSSVSRQKMSESAKGKPKSAETRARMSDARKKRGENAQVLSG